MTDQDKAAKASRQRRLKPSTVAAAGPPPEESVPAPPPVPVAVIEPPLPRIEEVEPAPIHCIGNSNLYQHDVVQIIDPASRLFGLLFAVGDVKKGRVHGYYLTEGRQKQFVTINLDMVYRVGGLAKVRSATPNSPKWLSDMQ